MTTQYIDPKRNDARNAPHAKHMTSSQFDESWDTVSIVRREMHKSGQFVEKLNQQAFSFSLGQRFNQHRAEFILRDQYEARYGEPLKQTLDGLLEREAVLRTTGHEQALHYAKRIEALIKNGDTMPFYRAYDHAAVQMAKQHSITEVGAKSMMKEAFARAEGRELYEASKEVEKKFHTPKREAERKIRQTKRARNKPGAPVRHM